MYQIKKLPRTTFDFLINVIYQIRKFIRSGFIYYRFCGLKQNRIFKPWSLAVKFLNYATIWPTDLSISELIIQFSM